MSYPLAIFSPSIGIVSETFIQKHMTSLLPGKTVIITHNPDVGYWFVDCPVFKGDRFQPGNNFKEYMRFAVNRYLIGRFLEKHGVKVILGEYLQCSYDFFQLSKELEIPFFVHAHGYDVSALINLPEWQEKYSHYNQSSGIITINKVSRDRLIDLDINPAKIHVIPCGINVPDQALKRENKKNIRCLAVGRMIAKKAPIFLLKSFYLASQLNPDLRLDYVGSGELLSAVIQFVEAFNLTEKVTLHSNKPNEFVQQLMRECDIFIQHSITDPITGDEEGLPVSILEAMANSLPVISTNHAGIPEAIIDTQNGFLVNEGDCQKMADRILYLAENPEIRLEIGLRNWERANKNFTWQIERQKLLNLLQPFF